MELSCVVSPSEHCSDPGLWCEPLGCNLMVQTVLLLLLFTRIPNMGVHVGYADPPLGCRYIRYIRYIRYVHDSYVTDVDS